MLIIKKLRKDSRFRYLIAAGFNVCISTTTLQLLLLNDNLSIALCTLMSQLLHATIGYFLYGSIVWKDNNMIDKSNIAKFISAFVFVWLLNSIGIKIGTLIGLSKNIAAYIMMPFLAATSYTLNKKIFS